MSLEIQSKCPYIGTIKRHILDFDFEKVCSISLSTLNVYACLVCGKYFQGKGKETYAYSHSLEENHHLFINLDTSVIICLPDNYEVNDKTLDDIKSNLNPHYTKEEIENLDDNKEYSYSLAGKEFLPGFIGLNNIKCNDYVNVVLQAIFHLGKIRNALLQYEDKGKSDVNDDILIYRLSELCRKMWNKQNFKEHISPHEVLQSISLTSKNQFVINKHNDAILFLSWILNKLDQFFERKKSFFENKNIINKYCKGLLQVEIFTLVKDSEKKKQTKKEAQKIVKIDEQEYYYEVKKTSFYYLSMVLPNSPLFKDSHEKVNIPQIELNELLHKFDGKTFTEDPVRFQKRRYKILSYPKYLILFYKRFENNMFFTEKNPTIITFSPDKLSFNDNSIQYELVSNIIHDGKPQNGTFRIQIRNKSQNEWYEIQDLNVEKIVPQSIIVSESYIHFYEMNRTKTSERD